MAVSEPPVLASPQGGCVTAGTFRDWTRPIPACVPDPTLPGTSSPSTGPGRTECAWTSGPVSRRQAQAQPGASTLRRLGQNAAPVELGDLPDDRESETRAGQSASRAGTVEAIEDERQVPLG